MRSSITQVSGARSDPGSYVDDLRAYGAVVGVVAVVVSMSNPSGSGALLLARAERGLVFLGDDFEDLDSFSSMPSLISILSAAILSRMWGGTSIER